MELSQPTNEYPTSKTSNESERISKLNEDISKSMLNRSNSFNFINNTSIKSKIIILQWEVHWIVV